MSRALNHVTLTTGHSRLSPRSEVRESMIATLLPLVARALEGEHVPVPNCPGYTMRGARHGRCCLVTLYAVEDDGQQVPVLTTGVAGHSRCGAELWRIMHEIQVGGVATSPDQQPSTPWCGDRLEPGMAAVPEIMSWTGDWSRCVAWTWLEVREDGP